jgi:hypothetical protein
VPGAAGASARQEQPGLASQFASQLGDLTRSAIAGAADRQQPHGTALTTQHDFDAVPAGHDAARPLIGRAVRTARPVASRHRNRRNVVIIRTIIPAIPLAVNAIGRIVFGGLDGRRGGRVEFC